MVVGQLAILYVIYASGSAGQLKGVRITQHSLLNLNSWHCGAFEVTPADRAAQMASLAFDATGWELWLYITCGASVFLIGEQTRLSPPSLRDWLVEQHITVDRKVMREFTYLLFWLCANGPRCYTPRVG